MKTGVELIVDLENKRQIRLSENDLKQIVKESVNKVLNKHNNANGEDL